MRVNPPVSSSSDSLESPRGGNDGRVEREEPCGDGGSTWLGRGGTSCFSLCSLVNFCLGLEQVKQRNRMQKTTTRTAMTIPTVAPALIIFDYGQARVTLKNGVSSYEY